MDQVKFCGRQPLKKFTWLKLTVGWLYFAATVKHPFIFFFWYAWNYSTVITGYKDEWLVYVYASFGILFEFKLHGSSWHMRFLCSDFDSKVY